MKSYNEFQQELKSMKLANKDHFHFTNQCFYCREYVDDSEILPVKIIRNGYIENDYCCDYCFKNVKGELI